MSDGSGELDFVYGDEGDDSITLNEAWGFGGLGNDRIIGVPNPDPALSAYAYSGALYSDATSAISVNLTGSTVFGLAGGNINSGFRVRDGQGGIDLVSSIFAIGDSQFDDQFIIDDAFTSGNGGKFLDVYLARGNDHVEFNFTGGFTAGIAYHYAEAAIVMDMQAGTATARNASEAALIGNDTFTGANRARGSTFDDLIFGKLGDDQLLRGYHGNDEIHGRGGNDRIEGQNGNDTIDGGDGADQLFGGSGLDLILGGAGNDTIDGGAGDDTLTGGAGSDVMIGGSGVDTVDYNAEIASGGTHGVTVNLLGSGSQGGLAADSATDTFGNTETVTGIRNVIGTQFADIVYGGNNANLLQGGGGNDTLSGGGANDVIDGGQGTDRILYSGNRSDYLIVQNADGTLTTTDQRSGSVEGTDLVSKVELFAFADGERTLSQLFGRAPAITSNGGGATAAINVAENSTAVTTVKASDPDTGATLTYSIIDGGDAAFFAIKATTGALSFVVAPNFEAPHDAGGNNVYDVTVKVSDGTFTDRQAIAVTVTNVNEITVIGGTVNPDILTGTAGQDLITGLSGDDVASGRGGNDQIDGGGGNDTLDGGAGADAMRGGAGNDVYVVDKASDVVDEAVAGSSGVDAVRSSISFSLANSAQVLGTLENLILTGAANHSATGNSLNNVLLGNAGGNALSGAAGNDTLSGGAGADSMRGGSGNDTYVVENAGDIVNESIRGSNGIDAIHSSISFSLANSARVLGAVENLVLTGSANVAATGNSLNNVLLGNAGGNALSGGGGHDTLNGGAGADNLRGGAGSDVYVVESAGDIVNESLSGSNGVDTVQSSISFSLANSAHVFGALENLTLLGSNNINAVGNAASNSIRGNNGDNVLNGYGGRDMLTGGAGNDTFFFNCALSEANNIDRITDFSAPADTIRLENAVFSALGAAGTLSAAAFHVGAASHDASDRIIYNTATGALTYDANGSAAGEAIQFATLSAGLTLTNADFGVV